MPQLTNKHYSKSPAKPRRGLLVAVLLAWFALLGLAAINEQKIIDWWRLSSYHPTATVASLASDDTLTSYARKILYVNAPLLAPKSTFNNYCTAGHEQTVVLGCYHGNQNGIFLLAVSDPRLNGMEQVTVAHEMLHAAYDRLSRSEKNKVNAMLIDYYQHGLHDQTIEQQIAGYQKTEPDAIVDEMHSIFGTEVATLPDPLEHYYQQYFIDRSKVTGMYAQYESEFTSRQAQVAQYDQQLAQLKTEINADETSAQAELNSLNSQRAQLENDRTSDNSSAYNAGVPGYNRAVDSYNAKVTDIRTLIAQYNQLVDDRNAIVLEEQQLMNDISSQVSPINQ